MLIKQFATKYYLSTDTVRYYEKEGYLHPHKQDNGYRVYDVTCEHTIKFILVLRQLGFTLQEIKQLLTLEQKPLQMPAINKQYNYSQQRSPTLNSSYFFITRHFNPFSSLKH
ncbi:MerR family transcriptional regulator [Lysinibacillus sphaericus]|uniref:MerR family transcriptional regulator n=1 Tax=Lysinibacillus sphaericus TaxID=1421 RepID=UPI0021070610|nr:MerR family transcriptional regulator [Lysinibacillus sp. SDF0037]